jgi:hypothetical protein
VLANTEAFSTVDEGDSSTAVELRFGQTLNQKIVYDRANTRFKFTSSLFVAGNLTTTGAAIINIGNTTAIPDAGLANVAALTRRGCEFLQRNPAPARE